jgi:hypothetical protein
MNRDDMKIAVATIQKNESKWIVEWFAWQQLQGVDKVIVYDHASEDNTRAIWKELSDHYNIDIYDVAGNNVHYPMMQHYLDTYRPDYDWVSYNDVDEFMLPMRPGETLRDVLWSQWDNPASALGIYWCFFGSNGHDALGDDPDIVTEAYTRRGPVNHALNHHMKSIVRGRGRGGQRILATNPHVFTTEHGTVDLEGRPILPHQGWNREGTPSHDIMRINHYWCKSWHWFKTIKQPRGYRFDRPDTDPTQNISDDFWRGQNLNDEADSLLWDRWGDKLLTKIDEVKTHLTISPTMYSRLST